MNSDDLSAALRTWFNQAYACWLTAHNQGTLAPLHAATPWRAEDEWAATGWTRLATDMTAGGVGPDAPLPSDLAQLRDEHGYSVVGLLLQLHQQSSHPEIWLGPLQTAMTWGCRPFTPTMDDDSALLRLFDHRTEAATMALFEAFDVAGVDWGRRFDPADPEGLRAGELYPWPTDPQDTLFEHALLASTISVSGAPEPDRLNRLARAIGQRQRPDLDRIDRLGNRLEDLLLTPDAHAAIDDTVAYWRSQDRHAHMRTLRTAGGRRPRS